MTLHPEEIKTPKIDEKPYIDKLRKIVIENPGIYSRRGLIAMVRVYGIKKGLGDLGVNSAEVIVNHAIEKKALKMRPQGNESSLGHSLTKLAYPI